MGIEVGMRKMKWKEIWEWEPTTLTFLLKSTYDVLPTPANLMRWKISEIGKSMCGTNGTLGHVILYYRQSLRV